MSARTWTDEADAELTRLWAEDRPRLSAAQIGKVLGCTRNAAIGRVHRLGLPGRASPIHNNGRYDTRRIAARESEPRKHKRKPAVEKKPVVQAPAMPPSLFRTCQWIEGLPSADDSCKCGAPTAPGRPYCKAHEARAYSRRAA